MTLAAVACSVLAACGGGGQVTKFAPDRVLSFGDETSLITASGSKFTVNGLTGSSQDCVVNPIWNQILANSYKLPFAQCPGVANATRSRILATEGAKAADVKTQIDQFLSTDRFSDKDLVTVLAGPNDLWAQYAAYNGSNEPQLIANMEAAGTLLATQVNRIADAGGKVIISTMPDQSLTPYALAQRAAFTGTDRAALIKRLMTAFHIKLRVTIVNDGTRIGLVLADELVQLMVQFPSSYNHVNINTAACLSTAVLPTCTSATLVPGANGSTWLWADSTRLAAGGHSFLGELARQRATGNPF